MARKSNDRVLEDGQTTDIVIPLMGPTKAGKSTLINRLLSHTGHPGMQVGKNMVSCTSEIAAVIITEAPPAWRGLNKLLQNRRLVLVDTPGFDDTYMGDDVILMRISQWLESSYRKGMLVGGVLYLHDITRDGFPGSARKNLTLFSKICGDDAMDLVAFVTTKWDKLFSIEEGTARVQELQETPDFWKPMIDLGASVHHLRPSHSSRAVPTATDNPWDIIYKLVVDMEVRNGILQIQDEMVVNNRFLTETEAGKEVRLSLQNLLNAKLELQRRARQEGNSARTAEAIQKRQEEIEKLTSQLKALKVPSLAKRAKRLLRILFK